MASIILFGGTFDPVHLGHLAMAEKATKVTNAEKCIWIPNKIPLLKADASASSHDRLAMLALAMKESPYQHQFEISQCELNRDSPSYTAETVSYFRQQYGLKKSLLLLMGEDAFIHLNRWYQWQTLLKQVNIIITSRPAQSLQWPEAMRQYYSEHFSDDITTCSHESAGHIYKIDLDVPISSTSIRQDHSYQSKLINQCPESVASYIQSHHLYSE